MAALLRRSYATAACYSRAVAAMRRLRRRLLRRRLLRRRLLRRRLLWRSQHAAAACGLFGSQAPCLRRLLRRRAMLRPGRLRQLHAGYGGHYGPPSLRRAAPVVIGHRRLGPVRGRPTSSAARRTGATAPDAARRRDARPRAPAAADARPPATPDGSGPARSPGRPPRPRPRRRPGPGRSAVPVESGCDRPQLTCARRRVNRNAPRSIGLRKAPVDRFVFLHPRESLLIIRIARPPGWTVSLARSLRR